MANTRRRTQRANRTSTRATARAGGSGVEVAVYETEEVRAGRTLDWQNEFKYIKADLRQLLIVSTILFALLFVVGFFLN